jgi:signal transduction histidine kinase
MLQLMLGSVRAEQAAEEERTRVIFGQALHTAASSLVAHLKTGERKEDAAALAAKATRFFNQCFAESAAVRLLPPGGVPIPPGGVSPVGPGPILAEASLDPPLAGWRVQLSQGVAPRDSAEALHYQIQVFTGIVVGAVLLNMTIAGLAGFALNRQMRVQELKSSSLETVSHELKTPLASTRILLDTLLARSGSLDQSTVEYVRLISDENSRLIHLTESFLTLARLERGGCRIERRPVPPSELFDAAVQTALARTGTSQPAVRIDIPRSLP